MTHGDRHSAPSGGITGPLGLSLKPPDIGLPVDLNLKLRALLVSRHVQQLARQADPSHPCTAKPRRTAPCFPVFRRAKFQVLRIADRHPGPHPTPASMSMASISKPQAPVQ